MNQDFSRARREKNRDFDGKFYFGVKSTGIFCRPSCPAREVKEENVVYFTSMFEALEYGYRPCLRCRPDLETEYYNGNAEGTQCVTAALDIIKRGYLNDHPVKELAAGCGVSERHLRRLFLDNLGATPHQVGAHHRAITAKKWIVNSRKSFSEIASLSGFRSLRQFNSVIKKLFGKTPSEIRSSLRKPNPETAFSLEYRQPFDFARLLEFFRRRALPGVERVTDSEYSRTFQDEYGKGMFTVRDDATHSALRLSIDGEDIRSSLEVCNRVRRMFDTAADIDRIAEVLRKDGLLFRDGDAVSRLPATFDPYEFLIRAILEQHMSVEAATATAGHIVTAAGLRCGDDRLLFPAPRQFLRLDLNLPGLPATVQETLRTVTRLILSEELNLSGNQTFEAFREQLLPVKGVEENTIHRIAMHGLGMRDCFPVTGPVILNGRRLESQ